MIVKNVEKKEKSTVTFDVLCDAAEFEKAVNGAYLKNRSKIMVPGFRKGKAPRMVIEGMYGKDVFYDDAADDLAPEAFAFAVEQEGLRTVGSPAVKAVDVSDDKELTLSFVTAVWPEVKPGSPQSQGGRDRRAGGRGAGKDPPAQQPHRHRGAARQVGGYRRYRL